ncbi:MAG: M15 family metallopeptidase [Ilumatobacteraceae bacterium]
MPDFGQEHLSVDPLSLEESWSELVGSQSPLPTLVEPTSMPAVSSPVAERLVSIVHPRISTVEAYRLSGWTAAIDGMWLRSGAMERLGGVVDRLGPRFGLHVFDAWRPLQLQAELYEAAYADPSLPPGFVSEPTESPLTPPPHLTGGTVDLTLTLDGIPLSLGTSFDDFSLAARADSLEMSPSPARDLRRLLYHAMRAEGFVVLDCEWWHYEYGTRRWAALTGNEPLYGPASLDVRLSE